MRSLNRILFDAHEVSAGDRVVLPASDARAVHIRQVLLQQGGGAPTELSKVRTCHTHPPLSAVLALVDAASQAARPLAAFVLMRGWTPLWYRRTEADVTVSAGWPTALAVVQNLLQNLLAWWERSGVQ